MKYKQIGIIIFILLSSISCKENSKLKNRSTNSLFGDTSYLIEYQYKYPEYRKVPEISPDTSPFLYQEIKSNLMRIKGLNSNFRDRLVNAVLIDIDSLVNSDIRGKDRYLYELYQTSKYTSNEAFLYIDRIYDKREHSNTEILIDSSDLKRLGVNIRFQPGSNFVNSSTFVNYNYSGNDSYFYFCNSWLPPVRYSDTLLFPMITMGERGFTIFTAWKLLGSKCKLITILDRTLSDYYSSAWIEKIYRLPDKKFLLAGRMIGGDECDYGSCWIGIWDLPRSLKVIWYNDWDDCKDINNHDDHDTNHLYNYTFRYDSIEMMMAVDKTDKMSRVPKKGKEKLLRQDTETFNLDIKNLMKKNLTDKFNEPL